VKRTPYGLNLRADIDRIESQRRNLSVTHIDLVMTAGVAKATWERARHGGHVKRATMVKLRFALRTIANRQRMGEQFFEGGDIEGDTGNEKARGRSMSNPEFKAASVAYKTAGVMVRSNAVLALHAEPSQIYLTVAAMGVNRALVARVYGCSKQYISKIMQQMEDRREVDAGLNTALDALEQMILEG
jgi:CRP-like cAMP-binding protein